MMMKLTSTLLPFLAVVLLVLPQAYAGPKKGKKGKKMDHLEFKQVITSNFPDGNNVPRNAGDRWLFFDALLDDQNQEVGKVVATCTWLSEDWYCSCIFSFDGSDYHPKGQIAAVGNMFPMKDTESIITGCTGDHYEGCSGFVKIPFAKPGDQYFTYHVYLD
jgi:hypothetical protein